MGSSRVPVIRLTRLCFFVPGPYQIWFCVPSPSPLSLISLVLSSSRPAGARWFRPVRTLHSVNGDRYLSTMYHPTKKPYYSPVKHAFPRRCFDPSRIILVAIVLLLLFFLRFESPAAITVTEAVREVSKPAAALPGFRPLSESRIAIVTFTTEQKSFTHLSLKNKACMY